MAPTDVTSQRRLLQPFISDVRRRAGVRAVAWAPRLASFLLAALLPALWGPTARAASPSDADVRDAVSNALAYLEEHTDARLGGKALIGLAFHKAANDGLCDPQHPRIQEAHQACREMADQVQKRESFIYGKALAIIFLAEANGDRELMLRYMRMLVDHQRPHGGFTYLNYPTGDTSQTQYAALTYWELLNHGSRPDADSVQRCINWLMRTQDPSGVWGYQGFDPGSFELAVQNDEPGISMAAAGMGGLLILGNILGILLPPTEQRIEQADLPEALKRSDIGEKKRGPSLPRGDVDPERVRAAYERGRNWFTENFKIHLPGYSLYYLYSVERYKSFEEYIDGVIVEEPQWYNLGVEQLKKTQRPNGSWSGSSGTPCATAFGVLFLLRSTQQSIKARLGEGTLIGGRGLPRDLSKMRVRGGKLVVDQPRTDVDQLIDLLSEDSDALSGLVDDPHSIQVNQVQPEDARRLQQIVRSGSPEARLLAVRALARLRQLDYAPSLIHAMTDPDRRVVLAARDGLRSLSRQADGFGLSDSYDEAERAGVVDRWRRWYLQLRPDAVLVQ